MAEFSKQARIIVSTAATSHEVPARVDSQPRIVLQVIISLFYQPLRHHLSSARLQEGTLSVRACSDDDALRVGLV